MKTVLTGQPERIYVEFRDIDHDLTDPSRPRVTIYAPSGTEFVPSAAATQESTGVYWYLLSVGTAYSNERGTYQAFWEGYINGAPIYMDEPMYIDVLDSPYVGSSTSEGRSFVREIRNAINDNRENEYMILPRDMNYYVQDGVRDANATYNMGYTVFISTAGNDRVGRLEFQKDGVSTALGQTERAWYSAHVVRKILEAQTYVNMFGPGIINAGDIKVNIASGLRAQTGLLDRLDDKIDDMGKELKLNGGVGGYAVNTFAIADLYVSEY
jgi:hypothetical protein